jgi:hypothetical protein
MVVRCRSSAARRLALARCALGVALVLAGWPVRTAAAAQPAPGPAASGAGATAADGASAGVAAAPRAPRRTMVFAVELASADPALRPAWQLEALRAVLAADLAVEGLRPARASAERTAAPGALPWWRCSAARCDVTAYRDVGVDLVLRVALASAELRYQLWWVGAAPEPLKLDGAGAIALGAGQRRGELAQALITEIRAAQRRRAATQVAAGEKAAAVAAPQLRLELIAVTALALLFAIPLLVAAACRLAPAAVARLRSTRISALLLLLAGAAVLASARYGELVTRAPTAVFLLGGLAWGTLLAALVPAALPPLLGLSRVEYDELFLVLGAWLSVAWRRTALVATAALAVGAAALAGARALELSPQLTWGVALPLSGLAVWHALRALVDVLALRLDRVLVDGEAGAEEPWHDAVAGYVRGYFRRNGLGAQEALLSNVWFLPGARPGIAFYGGGLAASRVVIERRLLERALAPYGRPHDYAAPRVSTLHWMQWNAGLIVPTEVGSAVATRDQRQPRELIVESDEQEHQLLGEPVTLAGVLEPAALDPRRRYLPHQDTAWLAWDPGEGHDGTDAGDQDWLFGALVVALGAIARGEDRTATLRELVRARGLAMRPARRRAVAVTPAAASSTDAAVAAATDMSRSRELRAAAGTGMAPRARAAGHAPPVEPALTAQAPSVAAVEAAPAERAPATPTAGEADKRVAQADAAVPSDADEPRMIDGTKELAAVADPDAEIEEARGATEPDDEPRMIDGTKEFAAVADPDAEIEEARGATEPDDEPRMIDGTKELAAVADPDAVISAAPPSQRDAVTLPQSGKLEAWRKESPQPAPAAPEPTSPAPPAPRTESSDDGGRSLRAVDSAIAVDAPGGGAGPQRRAPVRPPPVAVVPPAPQVVPVWPSAAPLPGPAPARPSALRRALQLWDRGSVRLGDIQAALHAARHHLAQALGWSLWQRDDLLTARAHPPELERVSVMVLHTLELEAPADRVQAARLRWLAPLLRRAGSDAEGARLAQRRRRRALLLAAAVAAGLVGFAVASALSFHTEYVRRRAAEITSPRQAEGASDHGQR